MRPMGMVHMIVDHLSRQLPESWAMRRRLYPRPAGKYRPHQGMGECDRRRRQIAAGQLTEANGLARGAA